MQHAVTPLDGRYANKISELAPIVSEFGLMRNRLYIMLSWVKFLSDELGSDIGFDARCFELVKHFSDEHYTKIKQFEKETNHDVKAVEYFIRNHLPETAWPWIHFACTSEDVNNLAYSMQLQEASQTCDEAVDKVVLNLKEKAFAWRSIPMLSRTHGQPATPTTVGKELAVFISRIRFIQDRLNSVNFQGKWSGATGNFAAHTVAFPDIDWPGVAEEFVKEMGFDWVPLTTQIESHDMTSSVLNDVCQLCAIFIDLCNDIWLYISNEYFGQEVVKTETGSSTMPGKVNPIDFENARGNFELARGMARTIADRLPISTWQRDLSDSTIQRNFGTVFGYYLLALKNLERGLGKLVLREDVLACDLTRHPEVLGEAIQTVLRKNGHIDAYEQLKDLLRGNDVSLDDLRNFIETLDVPADDKHRLMSLRPSDYVGLSSRLVDFL